MTNPNKIKRVFLVERSDIGNNVYGIRVIFSDQFNRDDMQRAYIICEETEGGLKVLKNRMTGVTGQIVTESEMWSTLKWINEA